MTQDERLALDARSYLGEGPRWHSEEKPLYWVDIGRNELHRFDPVTGHDESRAFATPIGCFAFMRDAGLMLAMKDGFASHARFRSEEHTSELQSLMRNSYAVFCLKKKKNKSSNY